jgi:hypothetical protein
MHLRIILCIDYDARMRRITVSLDDLLEGALDEAPARLGVPDDAADSEKLRAYARLGYVHTLEAEVDEARMLTYRAWAVEPETGSVPKAASRRAAARGVFEDR